MTGLHHGDSGEPSDSDDALIVWRWDADPGRWTAVTTPQPRPVADAVLDGISAACRPGGGPITPTWWAIRQYRPTAVPPAAPTGDPAMPDTDTGDTGDTAPLAYLALGRLRDRIAEALGLTDWAGDDQLVDHVALATTAASRGTGHRAEPAGPAATLLIAQLAELPPGARVVVAAGTDGPTVVGPDRIRAGVYRVAADLHVRFGPADDHRRRHTVTAGQHIAVHAQKPADTRADIMRADGTPATASVHDLWACLDGAVPHDTRQETR